MVMVLLLSRQPQARRDKPDRGREGGRHFTIERSVGPGSLLSDNLQPYSTQPLTLLPPVTRSAPACLAHPLNDP